jgi:hypothetical protein
MTFFVCFYLLLRILVYNFKESPFLYAKVHKKVGIGPPPGLPNVYDEVEWSIQWQEDMIEWGWLEDEDEDKDDSNNWNISNKFSSFSV